MILIEVQERRDEGLGWPSASLLHKPPGACRGGGPLIGGPACGVDALRNLAYRAPQGKLPRGKPLAGAGARCWCLSRGAWSQDRSWPHLATCPRKVLGINH